MQAEGKDISGSIRYRWNESEKEELLKAEHKQTKSDSAKFLSYTFQKELDDTIPGSEGIMYCVVNALMRTMCIY